MLYLLAIFLPPVAILFCGFKPLTFLLNCGLTLLGWIPGSIHACLVVNSYFADKRTEKLVKAMKRRG